MGFGNFFKKLFGGAKAQAGEPSQNFADDVIEKVKDMAEPVVDKVEELAETTEENVSSFANDASEDAEPTVKESVNRIEEDAD